jgi:hypothetical protein
MAFSGKTVTQPVVGSEARKIKNALRSGVGITSPAHAEIVAKLRQLRKKRTKLTRAHSISQRKSV